jgi:acyl carrier protein
MSMSPGTSADTSAATDRLLAIVMQLVRETHPGRSYSVTMDSHFERDLELDSLARVELMLRVGQAFNVELSSEALGEAETPRDVLRFLGQAPHEEMPLVSPALGGAGTCGVPDDARSVVDALEWHVARQPDRMHILLYDDRQREEPILYRDLFEAASATAGGLIARGLQPRQTVALMLPTGRGYLASFFGVMIAGGVPVPIYPPARSAQIADHLKRHARILSNAEATLIITVAQAKPVAVMLRAAVPSLTSIVTPEELIAAPVRPRFRAGSSDIALLQYTSGSTGDPKGVVLTHANLLANIRALGQATKAGPEDVFVSWLPLYHDMGLISAWLGSLYHGMPLVLMSPLAFLARPVRWLQAISRHRGTISGAPNFAYELCVRNITDASLRELDLSSWRLAFNGAEPVRPATLESFACRFAPCGLRRQSLTPVYGLAESSVGLTMPPLERGPHIDVILRDPFVRSGNAVRAMTSNTDTVSIPACGRPLPGQEIRVVDEVGHELPERRIGHLQFRGPSATAGYYRNPEATRKLRHDGWLDSGDYAYMVEGEVYITGRVKDLIIRGGRNFYPYDLEAAIGNLPGVRRGCVAVFASPDPVTGTERLVIMAETREQDESVRSDLRRHINAAALDVIGTAADDIVLAPPHAVPKTSSGKIRRIASRQAYERGLAEKRTAAPWILSVHIMATVAWARITLMVGQAGRWAYGCYAWAAFLVLALPVGGLVALMQRPAAGRRLAHIAAKALFHVIRIPISAKGLNRLPPEPHVLLVNHASFLDSIVLTAILSPTPGYTYVAKRELMNQPLFDAVLKGLGTIFVERFDAKRSAADLGLMVEALEARKSLLVFPEGTFSREAGLKPFHTGAFLAAAKANVPVTVAGLAGTRAVLRGETWLPRRSSIQFEVGSIISPRAGDWVAAAQMSAVARKAMVPLSGEFDSFV